MPRYVFAYHGGRKPETPEEGEKEMAKWGEWFAKMGDAVVDGGNPVGPSKTVTGHGVEDNGGPNPLSGYTLVEAANIDDAVELAKGCPILTHGTVEVAEATKM